MQITVLSSNKQSLLSIHSTDNTKHALQTQTLSLRERQLLLLIDKNDKLSEQAVAKLIDKVNLDSLCAKGYLSYKVLSSSNSAVATFDSQGNNLQSERSKNVKLQNFMKTYVNVESDNTFITKAPTTNESEEITLSQARIGTDQSNAFKSMDADNTFEDIKILQGLLEF